MDLFYGILLRQKSSYDRFTIVMQDGKVQTAYGKYKYSYEELLSIVG